MSWFKHIDPAQTGSPAGKVNWRDVLVSKAIAAIGVTVVGLSNAVVSGESALRELLTTKTGAAFVGIALTAIIVQWARSNIPQQQIPSPPLPPPAQPPPA